MAGAPLVFNFRSFMSVPTIECERSVRVRHMTQSAKFANLFMLSLSDMQGHICVYAQLHIRALAPECTRRTKCAGLLPLDSNNDNSPLHCQTIRSCSTLALRYLPKYIAFILCPEARVAELRLVRCIMLSLFSLKKKV